MQRFQNTYTGGLPDRPAQGDWGAEIQGGAQPYASPVAADNTRPWRVPQEADYVSNPAGQLFPAGTMPQMRESLSQEAVQNPVNLEEAHQGSLKAMLARNEGNYVVATFLVGTQGTVSWEGILHDVGNDFVTIYQPGRERYVVIEIYSLKYIEFYDTRRREQCEAMLKQNGWQSQG